MKFDSIRMVLVATSHPGNIGAAARAMKTMGFGRLYLVSPASFPDKRAFEMAAGADDVLANAVVTKSLIEAVEDCQLVLGTSARTRYIAPSELTPRSQADLVQKQSDTTKVAIVFGREQSGLTNEELLRCHYHIHIPADPAYSSLNLAQAVQIISYELRLALLGPSPLKQSSPEPLARVGEVEQFYEHLRAVLVEIEFLKLSNPKHLMQRLRRLFNRARLEPVEVNILRGILTQIHYALNKNREAPE